ncbi:hypothetical protein N7532_001784 [Penicillium argentinense]|uniref:Xylanolytic transcriptional activator regulatory domain-containing protein n=1 Tax=Penicillium argentinense TaxID=1131581 RepID=A0A9W9G348_9EURO|nr:uncharacterized protein N7532_001784 [Penicillium argentinense]KAJ5111249.1 hypothetical protein N7532_001784 [Penicillium argentinense]
MQCKETCVKAGEECVFPGDKRAPRQLNRLPVGELLTRLKDLESEVQELRSKKSHSDSEKAAQRTIQNSGSNVFGLPGTELSDSQLKPDDDFRHQYLQPGQSKALWTLYQDNVAPLVAILHIPTTRQLISNAVDGVELNAAQKALLFSICFSAVISMTPKECKSKVGQERYVARQDYGNAVERALDDADFLKSKDISTLQAAVLFLLCSRAGGNTRLIWVKAAVVIRLAQSLQVHRDGEKLGLTPFETEIRRRLWCYICILDTLSSEDQAVDTQIRPGMFDAQFPSNIDGDELSPDMAGIPPVTKIFTDITPCIMTCMVLNDVYWSSTSLDQSLPMSLRVQEERVTKVGKTLQEKYLRHMDLNIPLQWISATIIRLQLSRAWLLVQIPSDTLPMTDPYNDTAFETAVEGVNFSYLLQTNSVTAQWSWLCKSYRQWHVMAYILSELCTHPLCPETDHAWDLVTKMLVQWQQNFPKDTALEKPLNELVERTAAVRATKLAGQPGPEEVNIQDEQGSGSSGFLELGFSIDWLRVIGL